MYGTATYDLAMFGRYELAEAGRLLAAYGEGRGRDGCLERFGFGVQIGYNRATRAVWLEDENCNCLLYDEDAEELYQFYSLDYGGNEGSAQELYIQFNNWEIDPKDYKQLAYILEGEGMNEKAEDVKDRIKEIDK